MATMTGARFLAETLHGYGVTHFFFMPVVIPEAMPEMERMGITRVMTHGEKAAAYMADGYARVRRGIGVCGAQSVGALNLGRRTPGRLSGLFPRTRPDGAASSGPPGQERLPGGGSHGTLHRRDQVQQGRDRGGPLSPLSPPGHSGGHDGDASSHQPGIVGDLRRRGNERGGRPGGRGGRALRPYSTVSTRAGVAAGARRHQAAGGGQPADRGGGGRRDRLRGGPGTGGTRGPASTARHHLPERQGDLPLRPPSGRRRFGPVLPHLRQSGPGRSGPGLLRGKPHRRPGDQRLADPPARNPGRPTGHRSGRAGAVLPHFGGHAGRRPGRTPQDAGPLQRRRFHGADPVPRRLDRPHSPTGPGVAGRSGAHGRLRSAPHAAGTAVQGPDPAAAGRRHSRVRHRALGHLDRHPGGPDVAGSVLHPLRRVPGMGHSRRPSEPSAPPETVPSSASPETAASGTT